MSGWNEQRALYRLWWLFMLRWALPGLSFVGVWLFMCWVGYEKTNSYFLYFGWIPALLIAWLADLLGQRMIRAKLRQLELEEGDEIED